MGSLSDFARCGQAAAARRKRDQAIEVALAAVDEIFFHRPSIQPHEVVGALEIKTGWSRSKAYRVWQQLKKSVHSPASDTKHRKVGDPIDRISQHRTSNQ